MKTKEQATRAAKKLLAKINTPGWSIRVWENLGWHYCLEHEVGGFSLSEFKNSEGEMHYICLLGEDDSGPGGSMLWTSEGSHLDPNEAIWSQVLQAQRVVYKLHNRIGSILKVL